MRDKSNQFGALLAGFSLGAVMMYILDPDRGTRRRALVRDQAGSVLRTGQREFRRRVEDLKHRAGGTVAEIRGRLREKSVDDDQLVKRIRAELGHHVALPSALDVSAHDGIVTLAGQVPRAELPDVLTTVRKVRGVEQVRDELQVLDPEAGEPSFRH